MRPNRVKRALREGNVVVGTMISEVRSPTFMQILALAGFDFVFIDMEHGAYDLERAADLIRVARLSGICPLVRVPDPQYHLISRPLDAGAQGLMIPRVESVEQVTTIVRSVKYPPKGERGFSGWRGYNDFQQEPIPDLIRQANEETMIILQIERKRAVERIDALLSIEGVDAALIGPDDLSVSLGLPGQHTHPAMDESIQRVIEACVRHNVACGIHIGNLDQLQRWRDRGMRMLTYSSPERMVLAAGMHAVKTLR